MPLMMLFMNLTTLVVVWLGGNQILGGKMQVGDLTAFTTYIVQVLMSLMMLAMVFLQSSRAFASGRRINEVMDTQVSLTDDHAAYPEAVVKSGKIEFQNVSFRYYKDSAEKVLDQINLTIEPGQMIGIIGSTGCGKTTLVSMIPRLYDVDEGKVLVDGIDVRDYSLNHLREGVGMVLQKNVLFSGTIEENLQWGDENAGKDQIRKAAESAQAEGFIQKLADGYDTELGQGGVNVSGGQKQRLCIARALLKTSENIDSGRLHERGGYSDRSKDPGSFFHDAERDNKADHRTADRLCNGSGSDRRDGRGKNRRAWQT